MSNLVLIMDRNIRNPTTAMQTIYRRFSRHYSRRRLAVLLNSLRHEVVHGAGDTTVYLVFDSTDSLSVAAANHGPGKFNGTPCEVAQVGQLESNWYTVQFCTDEFWGRHNGLDCRGLGR